MPNPRVMGDNQLFREDFFTSALVSDNGGVVSGSPTINRGATFDGAADYITYAANKAGVKTVKIILQATSTTEDILDFDGGTHTIEVTSGTLTATGFSSPTIYVDGAASSTLTTAEHVVVVTTATAFNATDLIVGLVGASYFDGTIKRVELYSDEWSAAEVLDDFNDSTYSEIIGGRLLIDLPLKNGFDDGSNEVTKNRGTSANWINGDGSTASTFAAFNHNPKGATTASGDYLKSGDTISIANDVSYSFLIGMRVDDSGGARAIFDARDATTNGFGLDMSTSNGDCRLFIANGGAGSQIISSKQVLNGGIHTIAGTVSENGSNTRLELYIDGELDNSDASATKVTANTDITLYMGRYFSGSGTDSSTFLCFLFDEGQRWTPRQIRTLHKQFLSSINI